MTFKPLHFAIAAALSATLLMAGCKKDAAAPDVAATPAPAPAPAPAPPPLSMPATDGKLGFEPSNFAPTDTIVASVSTSTSDPTASVSGMLNAKWTYQDGQVVNEEEKYFTFIGPGVTNFEISKPDGWPAGNYKLVIAMNGQDVHTSEFVVR